VAVAEHTKRVHTLKKLDWDRSHTSPDKRRKFAYRENRADKAKKNIEGKITALRQFAKNSGEQSARVGRKGRWHKSSIKAVLLAAV